MDEESEVIGTRPLKNTFIPRLLKYRFIGGKNQAGEQVFISKNKDNSRTLSNLKSECSIRIFGGMTMNQASIIIYNMPKDLANTISTVGFYDRESLIVSTAVEVYASIDTGKVQNPVFVKIFTGGIIVSYADLNAQPDPTVRIEAQTLAGSNLLPNQSISFKGDVNVQDIVERMVDIYRDKYGNIADGVMKVSNHGVDKTLYNPNYSGDFWGQLQAVANDADFEYTIANSILYMYPKGENLNISPYLFTPATGMIGYPSYSGRGIIVQSLFKPTLKFPQSIRIDTNGEFKPADGVWNSMVSMVHNLSCNMPGGPWFTTIEVAKQNIRNALSATE